MAIADCGMRIAECGMPDVQCLIEIRNPQSAMVH